MGNSYLKYILLFILLFCFTANNSFANFYSSKANTAAINDNTKDKGAEENPELKLELGITQFSRACAQLFLIDNEQLRIIIFKIQLPNAFHSLPELPPRN